jgi:hypothetical protein
MKRKRQASWRVADTFESAWTVRRRCDGARRTYVRPHGAWARRWAWGHVGPWKRARHPEYRADGLRCARCGAWDAGFLYERNLLRTYGAPRLDRMLQAKSPFLQALR